MIGAFLPLRFYALPIFLIYGGAFWAVHLKSDQCLNSLEEALPRFCSQLILTLITALVFQASLHSASNTESESEKLEEVKLNCNNDADVAFILDKNIEANNLALANLSEDNWTQF